jgi:hypothetical protein|tara:strand:- start:1920 stop:2141 length:222 start_codon:yes stop_codon:yes gene_type:complete
VNWVILVTLSMGDPFVIPYKTFEHEDACVEYVNSPDNADTLAVEVIAIAGFNDPITGIVCTIKGVDNEIRSSY